MITKLSRVIPLILVILATAICLFYLQTQLTSAQSNDTKEGIVRAKVLSVLEEEKTIFDNREYLSQKLQVEIISGPTKNTIITVDTSFIPKFNPTKYIKDDSIILGYMNGNALSEDYYVIGYERTSPLIALLVLFIGLSILIARKKGIFSLLGMGVSLLILITFILPAISKGSNPLLTALLGAAILTPILFYISHGVNMKTTSAIIGTVITLAVTSLLAIFFVTIMNLSGITFDEVETLLYLQEGNFDMTGVLIAGILMSTLGVIDDVAMTQTSVVSEIRATNKSLSRTELIQKAMNVGRDHIASVINTLILVYVGGSLTTLLLFTEFPRPLLVLINNEVVLIPIVAAIIGSIGLILAVPITTVLSAFLITRNSSKNKKG